MKRNYLFSIAAVLFAGIVLFSSCSQNGNLTIEKRRYGKGFYVHKSGTIENRSQSVAATEAAITVAAVTENSTTEINSQPAANPAAPVAAPAKTAAVKTVPEKNNSIALAPVKKAAEQKQPVKEKIRAAVKKHTSPAPAGDSDTNQILLVILALFIPPLAVYLKEGITNRFWIDLICYLVGGGLFLTPFFYGGGLMLFAVVFAILIVLDVI